MSQKIKKQFGVWIDTHQAIIVGRMNPELPEFTVIAHTGASNTQTGSGEKKDNNEKGSQNKLYKEILTYMQNAEEVHLTGTGTAQEQFINYMADIPQFKNAVTTESTSVKMSDEHLVEYISQRFN